MQSETRCAAAINDRLLAKRPAIVFVTADGMPCLGKMNADLVRAAGFESAFSQSVAVDEFDGADVRDRILTLFRIRHAPPFAIAAITSEK